jgi:sarcosine oxidase
MKTWDTDIAVVGVGIWGACTMWTLASRGFEVLGVERFEPGHGFGSSLGGSRMFRLTALEHPGLVPLARRSLELWRRLEREAGTTLLDQSGALLIGPPHGRIAGGTLRAARAHGIEVEVLGRREMRARFPRHAGLAPEDIAAWEPSAGVLRAEDSVRAAAGLAVQKGAQLLTDTRVHAIDLIDGGVLLRTQTRNLRARRVVLTVGPWLSRFAPALPLRTLRFPVTWFEPDREHLGFDLCRLPVFMRELADGTVLWGNGREHGHEVKLGVEVHGRAAAAFDPDAGHRNVIAADWQPVAELLAEYLPGLKPVPVETAVSMISQTPDGQFVLGAPGDDRRIVMAGGCNGHGFKHATGIGEAIADLVEGVEPRVPMDFISPHRFARS